MSGNRFLEPPENPIVMPQYAQGNTEAVRPFCSTGSGENIYICVHTASVLSLDRLNNIWDLLSQPEKSSTQSLYSQGGKPGISVQGTHFFPDSRAQ